MQLCDERVGDSQRAAARARTPARAEAGVRWPLSTGRWILWRGRSSAIPGASASPQTTGSALYVPGDRPDRFDKAVASGADAVILDLEDSVAPEAKASARANVVAWQATARVTIGIQVRINSIGTPAGEDDLAALPVDVALRVPKAASTSDLDVAGRRELHAIVESALGIEHAYEIASHPHVATVVLGEADLAAELGITDESALAWIRTRLVVAARAAHLPAPMMSAYPHVNDLDGLAASCLTGRRLGMRGRTAIHPCQLSVIADAFAPTDIDLAWARAVLTAVEAAGGGVAVLGTGEMVDAAMARHARDLINLAQP